MDNQLPSTTEIGRVALYVTDLDRSIRYYSQNIGFRVFEQNDKRATLGAGETELLVLYELSGARPVQRNRTGLYHFAILVPSRKALAQVMRHLAETQTRIDGASDHGVSEALYLSDPDGHGIEIYRDRPRSEWPFVGDALQMTLDPLQTQAIMTELGSGTVSWQGLEPDTKIGHVHLHVGMIAASEQFYIDGLGFELMQRFGDSASFVSAGGYHHHLGLNVWAGIGVPPPDPDRARLRWYEIQLPDAASVHDLVTRLSSAGITVAEAEHEGWSLCDPSGNEVHIVAA